MINVKHVGKFVVGLGDQVAPTDIDEAANGSHLGYKEGRIPALLPPTSSPPPPIITTHNVDIVCCAKFAPPNVEEAANGSSAVKTHSRGTDGHQAMGLSHFPRHKAHLYKGDTAPNSTPFP